MTVTLIGKREDTQRAKKLLNLDMTIFHGHCEKVVLLIANAANDRDRIKLIEETLGDNIPYIIKYAGQ